MKRTRNEEENSVKGNWERRKKKGREIKEETEERSEEAKRKSDERGNG